MNIRILRAHAARQGGFTLLEVLLAFVVFALSFALILEIIAGSMRSTVRAKDYSEAALLAQSIIETVGTEFPVEAGVWEGEAAGGYRWTLDIYEFDGGLDDGRTLEIAEINKTLLYWVDLNMEWGQGRRSRTARFTTIRSVLESRR